ncbi:MAG: DnaJ C-terminal domain-containing protein [bacterium]
MEFKDYYKILGVPRDADENTIKRAYRELAKKYHPDLNPGNKASEEKFREINEAYEVLSDPEKRAKYDQLGANWEELSQRVKYTGPEAPFGFDFDLGNAPFSEFFRVFFGNGGFDVPGFTQTRTRKARKGEDIHTSVEITLEEAFRGSTRTIEYSLGGKRKTLEVKIPPGIEPGTKIRLKAQGYPSQFGGQPGDMYLEVKVAPHPYFQLKGKDIYLEVPVTLTEAVLGAKIEVPSLKGKVLLNIPPETQNGTTFRLKGLGLPPTGDQYVKVNVVLPQNLTLEEKRLFEELKKYERTNPRKHLGL